MGMGTELKEGAPVEHNEQDDQDVTEQLLARIKELEELVDAERERGYEAGGRRVLISLYGLIAGGISGSKSAVKRAAQLEAQRLETVAALRGACAEYGDNDWDDDLCLCDVIEKHLVRNLDAMASDDDKILEATVALADAAELVSEKASIVQPFLDVYKQHGQAIRLAREVLAAIKRGEVVGGVRHDPREARSGMSVDVPVRDGGVYVQRAGDKGYGLFAAVSLQPGNIIARSPAVLLDAAQASAISMPLEQYVFEWFAGSDRSFAMAFGAVSFANHSNHPNCALERFSPKDGEDEPASLGLRALRAIAPSEELTFDYGIPLWFKDAEDEANDPVVRR